MLREVSGRRWSITVPHAKGEGELKTGDRSWQFQGHPWPVRKSWTRWSEMKLDCKSEGWGRTEGSKGVFLSKKFGCSGTTRAWGGGWQKKGYFRTKDHAAGQGIKKNWGLKALRDTEDVGIRWDQWELGLRAEAQGSRKGVVLILKLFYLTNKESRHKEVK